MTLLLTIALSSLSLAQTPGDLVIPSVTHEERYGQEELARDAWMSSPRNRRLAAQQEACQVEEAAETEIVVPAPDVEQPGLRVCPIIRVYIETPWYGLRTSVTERFRLAQGFQDTTGYLGGQSPLDYVTMLDGVPLMQQGFLSPLPAPSGPR